MSQSPLDVYRTHIERWVELGHGNQWIADELEARFSVYTTRDSIRRAKRRFGVAGVKTPEKTGETSGARIEADTAVLISRPNPQGTKQTTPAELMAQHGLDAEDWDFTATVNSWDALTGKGGITTLHQLKVSARRKPESILRDLTVKSDWKPRAARKQALKPVSHRVILPDPHAPFFEPMLLDASVALIETLQPAKILCLGDATDNTPWSRHKPNPRFKISAEDALWSTYDVFASWRNAAPDAEMEAIWGNHDYWLLDRVKEQHPELVTLRRPHEETPYISMGKLLRLDDLRIKHTDTLGEYHDITVELQPDLVAMHGTKAGKHGGAILEIEGWEGASIIQGHDHKTAIIAVNKRLPGGGHTQRYAISAGTMAKRDLGYDPKQNVSQSFVVITEWEDGRWHPELVLYDPVRKDVTYRDWRYSG